MEKELENYFSNRNWTINTEENNVSKNFIFSDFISAFAWMSEIALYAEKLNHHPEWTNVYNKINIVLKTHDHNKVTDKDVELAKIMDRSFEKK